MSTRTFGADEAGRGPILGPLVIAVVGLEAGTASALTRRGVCDSKGFGSGSSGKKKRAALAELIREKTSRWAVREVSPEEVDAFTFEGKLNVLERKVVRELLRELNVEPTDRIICDGANMFAPLRDTFPQLEAVNKGESVHVSVAAASILAKDARDKAFAKIEARYEAEFGPIRGGGYLNAATRAFLDAYANAYGGLPEEARKSWGAKKNRS